MSFGSLDLQALKETAAAAAAAQRGGAAPDGLPCSEAEMKALMGMFVEIMGMSMDGNGKPGNGKPSSNGGKRKNAPNNPMLSFGNQPPNMSTAPWPDQESLAAATAGFFADGASWDAIRRTYGAVYQGSDAFSNTYDDEEDDDDENESIPDLDDMCDMLDQAGQRTNSVKNTIAPGDWESLEKVAVEDALEAEDRERKAAKKREKKQRRKQKQKHEAAAKAADAAEKKREKAILSWRSRVVSACQSGELPKLDALLQESPLDGKPSSDEEESIDTSALLPHLEFLLPSSIAKNRTHLERGKETRHRLASYILSLELRLAFVRLRSGRTALHTACFQGDLPFVELVLEHLEKFLEEQRARTNASGVQRLSRDDLNGTCSDSGWTPLHYAAVSGSTDVLEVLLRAGCDIHQATNDTHTWRGRYGSLFVVASVIGHSHRLVKFSHFLPCFLFQ
jgi:hypothetical protein